MPACFGTGDFARQAYVVIERIPGQTLYKRIDELPLAYEEARVLGGKIASALAALHRQHVIHHDIKPSSVMFRDNGEAVLIDFGLSHHNHLPDLLQEEFRLPYGTAPYMAPERLLGCGTIRAATCSHSACSCISSPPASGRSARRNAARCAAAVA